MTKHLIGFGLFAVIVGVFVAASWIFTAPTVPIAVTPTPVERPKFGTYCDKKNRPTRVDSPRAIGNRHNGEITLYLNEIPGLETSALRSSRVSFAFYVVNGGEPRLMGVVRDDLLEPAFRDNGTKWVLQYEAAWLKGLTWSDNLYVVPVADEGSAAASFSVQTALPVLMQN